MRLAERVSERGDVVKITLKSNEKDEVFGGVIMLVKDTETCIGNQVSSQEIIVLMTEVGGKRVKEFGLSGLCKGEMFDDNDGVIGVLFRYFLNREVRYRKATDGGSMVCCCQSLSCDDLFMKVCEANADSEGINGVIFHDIFTGKDQDFLKLLSDFNFKINSSRNRRVCDAIEELLAIYQNKQVVIRYAPPAAQCEAVVSPAVATSSPLLFKEGVSVQVENTARDDINGRKGVISQCLENGRHVVKIGAESYSLSPKKLRVLEDAERPEAVDNGLRVFPAVVPQAPPGPPPPLAESSQCDGCVVT